jgi:hypothetical protein
MDTDELKIGKYFREVVCNSCRRNVSVRCDMLAKKTTRLEHKKS